MYKIKSIRIVGMHNVQDTTYNFGQIAYLVGKNGAGKSTVLQAIQLGLLGYIPNNPKTNDGTFKHCNNGKEMSIYLTITNGDAEYVISRKWTASGSSIKASASIIPELDMKNVIGDLELPIYNFNEFTSLTANKLKEWFISFLPSSESSIDWETELTHASDEVNIIDDNLIEATLQAIEQIPGQGVDKIKAVNAMIKENISYTKGRSSALQGTIDSLVYYDDVSAVVDVDEVNRELSELNKLRADLASYISLSASQKRLIAELDSISVASDTAMTDPGIHKCEKIIIDADAEIADKTKELTGISDDLVKLKVELAEFEKLAKCSGRCPYTEADCETVKQLSSEAAEKANAVNAKIAGLKLKQDTIQREILEQNTIRNNANSEMSNIQQKYYRIEFIKSQLKEVPDRPTELSDDEIQCKIAERIELLNKAAANKKYEEMNATITSEKFKFDNTLEVYKLWDKLTGPNGLQSTESSKPFADLVTDLSTYLSQMFGKDILAFFDLREKANSFSFGIYDTSLDKYITFDTLSSGEKCLFTVALMMCIVNRSESDLKVIIVDDLLDHLDDDNASFMFDALSKIKDIQFILAGVQDCNVSSIKIEI